MIDDVLVIDAVAHALDLTEENWNNSAVCESFREFGYYGIHQLAVPVEKPHWGARTGGLRPLSGGHRRRRERDLPRELDRRVLLPRNPYVAVDAIAGRAGCSH